MTASAMRRAFVSIGSNVERERYVRAAGEALRTAFGSVIFSPVYETGAVGFDGQPFYNLVAGFDTAEPAQVLVEFLKAVESRNGRVRGGARFSDRTLDMDLLLLGEEILEGPGFQIPRDEILKNAFVLGPLADIAADVVHPGRQRSIGDLWRDFDLDGQWLRPVPFDWPWTHGLDADPTGTGCVLHQPG